MIPELSYLSETGFLDAAKILYTTPGLLKGWGKAEANQNFPQYAGGAMMLDGVGYFDKLMEENPEEILDFSNWMAIPFEARNVILDRFKRVLIDAMDGGDRE